MRGLKRDERTVYYAQYLSDTYITDAAGYKTGEKKRNYSSVAYVKGTLSHGEGKITPQFFGSNASFDRVFITHDMSCPINENSLIWIDNPTTDTNDYIVACIPKKTPNCIAIALRRATVS